MNIILKALYVCFVLSFILVTGCGQEVKDTCHEFNSEYPRLVSKAGSQPDTLILIRALNNIINKNPLCLDAYLTRGDLHLSSNKILLAKNDYQASLKIDSENVYALYKLGLLFQDAGLYDSSISFLNKAILFKTHGDFVVDHPQVNAELSTNKAKYDVIAVELLYTLGVSYYYGRNLQLALRCFNSCINNKYFLGKAYLYIGAIYIELNKPRDACENFLQAKNYGNDEAVSYLAKYCEK